MPPKVTDWDKAMGQRLRRLRLRAGLTQKDIAYELGVSFQMIQKYENGTSRIPAHSLPTLARLTCVPVQALIDDGT